jgi:hypothetical protein
VGCVCFCSIKLVEVKGLIPDCCVLVVAEGSMGKIACIQFVLTMMLDVREHTLTYTLPFLRGIHGPLYHDLFKNPHFVIQSADFRCSFQKQPTGINGQGSVYQSERRHTTYDVRPTTHDTLSASCISLGTNRIGIATRFDDGHTEFLPQGSFETTPLDFSLLSFSTSELVIHI